MKIGSLFIALGFQTTGAKELAEAEKATQRVAVEGAKATVAIAALGTAFGVMIDLALQGAVALKQFGLATGLSTTELQQWQFTAAGANVDGKEITDTIKSIQKAGADIRLGRGNIAPWQLLGVDPTQDPFVVLKNLRDALNRFPPDIARTVAAEAGISDSVFQMLRMSNLEFDKMAHQFVLQQAQAERLAALEGHWRQIRMELKGVAQQLTDALRPALEWTLNTFEGILKVVADFAKWLAGSTTGAAALRDILYVVGAAVVALSVAITTLTVAAGALTAILAAASVLPAVWAMGLLLAAVLAVGAGIVGIIALFQDLWVASKGGQSLFDWKIAIAGGNAMATIIESLIGLVDLLRGKWTSAGDDFKAAWGDLKGVLLPGGLAPTLPLVAPHGAAAGGTVQQTNHITVTGAGDPRAVGESIADMLARKISDAANQAAQSGY